MSLIRKIVEIVERTDHVDARKNITKLNRDIKSLEEKVRQYVDSSYADFMPTVINNESLIEEGKNFENEVLTLRENLKNETKNIYEANDEISKIFEELEVTNMKLKLSMKLLKIDKLLGKIKYLSENEQYSDVNKALNAIQLLLSDPNDTIIRRLDIYINLKCRLTSERKRMLDNLGDRFNSLVQLKEKSFAKTRAITVTITKEKEKLVECCNALFESQYKVEEVTAFLMRNIFEPIIGRAVSLNLSDNDKDYTMSLSYSIEPVTEQLRPNYSAVFANIKQVLFYLLNMNIQLSNGEFFLAYIMQERRKELFEMIFNNCLVYSIPKTFEEKNLCTMNADIEKLSKVFIELNIFAASDDESEHLAPYAEKVDQLFNEDFIKSIQSSVSELLKRDLHDMMLISEDTTLSTNTPSAFSRSMVSKSTLELIRLLEKIVREAKTCMEDSDKQNGLMLSIKAVLENYAFTVQLHHSKFMSNIPQQAALFYNNCMYLSNWVTNSRETEHYGMDRVIEDLEKQGTEVLECQIDKQKIQLQEILVGFDPSQSLNAFQPEHFKPIRQCLRQLDLLKNVWQTILPSELYSSTMASLLDLISSDIIKKVTAMEDISTTLSNGLVEAIKNIDEKGQAFFDANSSAFNLVPSWQKMLHLQFVLDASLVEITNSWNAGMISKSFKVEEVKRLIRSLFQNTDRRANALSSIV